MQRLLRQRRIDPSADGFYPDLQAGERIWITRLARSSLVFAPYAAMCGAAACALSASMLSHFSTTRKVSGPYLVCTASAASASTAAPYSMQPFSARTLGTLA